MAKVRIQCFGTRSAKEDGTQKPETFRMCCEQLVSIIWVQCFKYLRIVSDLVEAIYPHHHKPEKHNRPESHPHYLGSKPLKYEQQE